MKKLFLFVCLIISVGSIAQSVTEIQYPLYVQGVGSGNPPDDRKVPFACRMQINGLLANATYRYYSLFGNAPTGISGIGFYIIANQAGNFTRITSPSLATAGRYGQFTTNASGSATEWFIVEPSSAIDFAPGSSLYWRIFLNNGAGGTAVVTRITAANPVTVLGWGSGPTQGSGIRNTANAAHTAKNFVMLYDNEAGTGRPIAGTFIESDGTLNGSALNGDPFTAGYAPFYGDLVDGVDKAWGTIIPNNLPTGVRNISEFSLTNGTKINACLSTDGTYGATTTVNPGSGLTAIQIACTPSTIPVKLISFDASVIHNKVHLRWKAADETNLNYYILEYSAGNNQFDHLMEIPAAGNNIIYLKEDQLRQGTTQYRLKMVDMDGTIKYSPIAIVNSHKTGTLNIFPNPAGNSISVGHGKSGGNASITVYSIIGQKEIQQSVPANAVQTTIQVGHLAKGTYILVFQNQGRSEKMNFQKL